MVYVVWVEERSGSPSPPPRSWSLCLSAIEVRRSLRRSQTLQHYQQLTMTWIAKGMRGRGLWMSCLFCLDQQALLCADRTLQVHSRSAHPSRHAGQRFYRPVQEVDSGGHQGRRSRQRLDSGTHPRLRWAVAFSRWHQMLNPGRTCDYCHFPRPAVEV